MWIGCKALLKLKPYGAVLYTLQYGYNVTNK